MVGHTGHQLNGPAIVKRYTKEFGLQHRQEKEK